MGREKKSPCSVTVGTAVGVNDVAVGIKVVDGAGVEVSSAGAVDTTVKVVDGAGVEVGSVQSIGALKAAQVYFTLQIR